MQQKTCQKDNDEWKENKKTANNHIQLLTNVEIWFIGFVRMFRQYWLTGFVINYDRFPFLSDRSDSFCTCILTVKSG